jgi:hypothetical protein
MALEEDISKAIDANLTAEVSKRLKIRIQQAEDVERRAYLLEQEVIGLKKKLEMSEAQLHELKSLDDLIRKLETAKEQARTAAIDKQIVDLKIENAKERVGDMKELVRAVFANNQYKYIIQENGQAAVTASANGYPATVPVTRTVTATGEGAPPPPPSQS